MLSLSLSLSQMLSLSLSVPDVHLHRQTFIDLFNMLCSRLQLLNVLHIQRMLCQRGVASDFFHKKNKLWIR